MKGESFLCFLSRPNATVRSNQRDFSRFLGSLALLIFVPDLQGTEQREVEKARRPSGSVYWPMSTAFTSDIFIKLQAEEQGTCIYEQFYTRRLRIET